MKLYNNITVMFLVWSMCILFILAFGYNYFPHNQTTAFKGNFLSALGNWDGGHYLGIAQFGYKNPSQYAFFPLYPLLIKLLTTLTTSYLISALIISITLAYLSVQLLFNLTKDEKVIWWFLLFPTSFYLLTVYTESLFLFLSLVTFLALQKKNLMVATIFAALASATRLAGLALGLIILLEVLTTTGLNKKNWYVIFSPLGFFVYCLYLYHQTGDPFYFVRAESNWQRSLALPILGFWNTIAFLSAPGKMNQYFNILLDLLFSIFGVGMVIKVVKLLPRNFALYSLILLLLPLSTSTLYGMPRYILPIFPIFIVMSMLKNKYAILFFQMIFSLLLAAFSILFINGYWVT